MRCRIKMVEVRKHRRNRRIRCRGSEPKETKDEALGCEPIAGPLKLSRPPSSHLLPFTPTGTFSLVHLSLASSQSQAPLIFPLRNLQHIPFFPRCLSRTHSYTYSMVSLLTYNLYSDSSSWSITVRFPTFSIYSREHSSRNLPSQSSRILSTSAPTWP